MSSTELPLVLEYIPSLKPENVLKRVRYHATQLGTCGSGTPQAITLFLIWVDAQPVMR